MCTIGVVYRKSNMTIFKQCDLNEKAIFYEPKICTNKDIKYLSFERSGTLGPWCGINDYGVCFVAADAYLKQGDNRIHNGAAKVKDESIFTAYEHIITKCKTANEAVEFMKSFYEDFIDPDILIISDKRESYYMEAYNKEIVVVKLISEFNRKYFLATNHFRYIHGGVTFNEDHSSYLRLHRADEILLTDCSEEGIKRLLKDKYYGESVLSICRSSNICPKGEKKYDTQATAIFTINNNFNKISCNYQINGNPIDNEFKNVNIF